MASLRSDRQLRFRWNDHMQHVSKVLTLQRLEEQFCDVTLVSDDGFVMKAHQAILASTSSYFQRVLSEVASDQYPMIVLRGAKFREISCLLDYMYQGNTQVDQSLMESVLEVADMLEVKGLSRIRSNTSLKKFMGHSSTTTSTSTTCTEELTSVWRRGQGCGTGDNPSPREAVQMPTEVIIINHSNLTNCHQSSSPEDQDETQTSGIDLSLAKNEPWSPREGAAHSGQKEDGDEDGSCPAKKRRKHLDSLWSDKFDADSDPDWGRIATKLDDRSHHKPRTISLSSVTTTELGIKSERILESYSSDDEEEYIRAVSSKSTSDSITADVHTSQSSYRVRQPQNLCNSRSCSPKYCEAEEPETLESSDVKSSASSWDDSVVAVRTNASNRTWREMASDSSDNHENESVSEPYGKLPYRIGDNRKLIIEEQDPLGVVDDAIPELSAQEPYPRTPTFLVVKEHISSEDSSGYVNQNMYESSDKTVHSRGDYHPVCATPATSPAAHLPEFVYLKVKEKEATLNPSVNSKRQSVDVKPEELLCPLEERLRRPVNNVKRPMNKYMLFQNSMRPKLAVMYPGETSQNITQRLGRMWKDLPESEKAKWECKAVHLKEEHKRLHPGYTYNPKVAAQIKKEYSRARMERRNLYRINTYPNVEDDS